MYAFLVIYMLNDILQVLLPFIFCVAHLQLLCEYTQQDIYIHIALKNLMG